MLKKVQFRLVVLFLSIVCLLAHFSFGQIIVPLTTTTTTTTTKRKSCRHQLFRKIASAKEFFAVVIV